MNIVNFARRDALTLAEAGQLAGDPALHGGHAGWQGARMLADAQRGRLSVIGGSVALDALGAGTTVGRDALARYIAENRPDLRNTTLQAWSLGVGRINADATSDRGEGLKPLPEPKHEPTPADTAKALAEWLSDTLGSVTGKLDELSKLVDDYRNSLNPRKKNAAHASADAGTAEIADTLAGAMDRGDLTTAETVALADAVRRFRATSGRTGKPPTPTTIRMALWPLAGRGFGSATNAPKVVHVAGGLATIARR